MVRWAEVSRTTKRSPAAAAIGRSSTSCTAPRDAGRDRVVAEQHDARADFGGRMMQAHRQPLADAASARRRARARWRRCGRSGACRVGIEHHVAACDGVFADAGAGEIERAALARLCRVRPGGSAHGSNARAPSRPDGLTMTWSPTATVPDSTVPVTTVPTPARVKAAVDREAEATGRGAIADVARQPRDSVAQAVDAFARDGRDRQDLRTRERRSSSSASRSRRDLAQPLGRRRDRSW